jgi:RNA polymerase sigma-70 factor (ECF subfamily)
VRDFLDNPAAGAEALLARLQFVPRMLAALNQRRGGRLDVHELADLSQDVVLLVLRKLNTFFGAGSLDGWLYRICELELLNRLRKRRRGPVLVEEWAADADSAAAGSPNDDDRVALALQRLGGYEAEIIRLRVQEDLTFEEIAARLGVTAANAKTRYYRGLARLQAMLADLAPRTRAAERKEDA